MDLYLHLILVEPGGGGLSKSGNVARTCLSEELIVRGLNWEQT